MDVSVVEIRKLMSKALLSRKYREPDIDFIIDMYLGGELRGHTSHGLASFSNFLNTDYTKFDDPVVLLETNSLFMIDAKGRSGAVVGKRAADEAIIRAKKDCIGTAIIKNMDGWLRPGAIAQYIADQGFVALVTNDGRSRAIAPPGGFEPTLSTNPIAYGLPTVKESLVVDLATSKRAWGQVRLANKYGRDVPKDTFYTGSGEVAVDPNDVEAVMPFGEYKGFSLAFLVEIMNGSMIGEPMMPVGDANNFNYSLPTCGGFILVIDPNQTSNLETFKKETSGAIDFIKSTKSLPGQEIRIPGEKAGLKEAQAISLDSVELPDELWEELSKFWE